ncbi:MAG: hypothetical protein ACHQ7M_07730 [Chloroflexota bacterium]
MADAISAINNMQLGLLNSPEIAREQIPVTGQVQLANAQEAAMIAKGDQDAREMVQRLQQADSRGVRDALSGQPERASPACGLRRSRLREPGVAEATPLAAAHPRGLGGLVDFRA